MSPWILPFALVLGCAGGKDAKHTGDARDTALLGDSGVDDSGAECPGGGEATVFYADADGDGHGDPGVFLEACEAPPDHVAGADDCDDGDAAAFPGAVEVCDGDDDDCDGAADDGLDRSAWYADADGDGYGDAASPTDACAAPAGHVADATDCDDTDGAVNPAATEVCDNGADDDCDGGAGTCGIAGATLSAATADVVVYGAAETDFAGSSAAFLGDWDGDGFDDLLVGAAYTETADGDHPGAMYVVRGGSTGAIDLADAHATFLGEGDDDVLGYAAAGAGDVDGDGHVDFIASAYRYGDARGRAYLVHGPLSGTSGIADAADTATLEGAGEGDYCGRSVDGGRDVSGDGRDDVVVGCSGDDATSVGSGAAYVLTTAPTGATLTSATEHHQLRGEGTSDSAGFAVALAEDVDGDGVDEVLVGAPGANLAYVVLGPVTEDRALAEADARLSDEAGEFGWAVTGVGDMNGDGYGEVAVGAVEYGHVYVYAGSADGLSPADYFLLSGNDDEGDTLAPAGDPNGDGYADLLVGAPHYDFGIPRYGAAYLVLGPLTGDLEILLAEQLRGEVQHDEVGASLSGGGDFDGDGVDDLAIGAPGHDAAGDAAGAVYVLFGEGL